MSPMRLPGSLALLLLLSLQSGCREFLHANFQHKDEISLDTYLDTGIGYLPSLTQLSLCVHMKPYRRAARIPLLSYWAEDDDNEILISYALYDDTLSVRCCQEQVKETLHVLLTLHMWHHICVSLDLASRTLYIAFDDMLVERRIEVNETSLGEEQQLRVRGGGRLVVGQDLDNAEGGFSKEQALSGEIAHYQFFQTAISREEMKAFIECKDDIPYQPMISLNDTFLENHGPVPMAHIPASEVCKRDVNFFVLFPFVATEDIASALCRKLKGSMGVPATPEENNMVFDRFRHFSKKCKCNWSTLYWIGVKGNISSGQWVREGDGKAISWHNAVAGWNEPKKGFRCMGAGDEKFPYVWFSSSCKETMCTMCNFTFPPKVRVRGLCATSLFDNVFYIRGYTNQEPHFEGEFSSNLVWDGATWVMSSLRQETAVAKMDIDRVNAFPVGLHDWSVQGDKCGTEKEKLLLTACGEGEYTCASGDCIQKHQLCDVSPDCADESDELFCDPVEVPRGYTAGLPPPSATSDSLALSVSINITSVREFNLVEFRINIDVQIEVTWYDSRLTYKNLKEDYHTNKVKKPYPTWWPEMRIRDSTGSVTENVLHHDAMYVDRNSAPLPDDTRQILENDIYSGSSNKLIYAREETLKIMCYYDLRMYPFDVQECLFTLSIQDMSNKFGRFVEEGSAIHFLGRRRLLEYELFTENLTIYTKNNFTNAKIELKFENQYKYYLVNAFAPSLMMVIICLLTLGFDLQDFQDRIMVSLTSLLVLAAFFTQTSQSIPKTSYVKLIDAWYLALICVDFFVIVALVCVEVVRLREGATSPKHLQAAPFEQLRNNFVGTSSKAARMNRVLIALCPASLLVILATFSFLCMR